MPLPVVDLVRELIQVAKIMAQSIQYSGIFLHFVNIQIVQMPLDRRELSGCNFLFPGLILPSSSDRCEGSGFELLLQKL
jgi:hypothetical protein